MKKYEFGDIYELSVTGSRKSWYFCEIYEAGNPDEVAKISHSNYDEFIRLRTLAINAFEQAGKLSNNSRHTDIESDGSVIVINLEP